jgi:hypothetical protein
MPQPIAVSLSHDLVSPLARLAGPAAIMAGALLTVCGDCVAVRFELSETNIDHAEEDESRERQSR